MQYRLDLGERQFPYLLAIDPTIEGLLAKTQFVAQGRQNVDIYGPMVQQYL